MASGWPRFEHLPGTENPADMFTKPLAWNMLRAFVEPLPFWMGDAKDAPTGSSDPEGSDTSPSHEQPFTRVRRGKNRKERRTEPAGPENENPPVVTEGETPAETVSNPLWNNQYSALADENGQEILS